MNTGWEHCSDDRTSLGRFSRGTRKGAPEEADEGQFVCSTESEEESG